MGDNGGGEQEWTCCNDNQTLFILLYIAFVALAVITWKTLIAKPMRLIAVFLHEYSHALACWITGGQVRAIRVFDNGGGVTEYMGGCRCLIIPAGYLGCSFLAMIFIIMSGGRRTATVAAVIFTASLLVALCYAPNRTMVYLNLSYALLTIGFILMEWFWFTPILQYVVLFFGSFVGIISVADIYSDTVLRAHEGSDSYACYAEVCPCCYPRCVGLQWAILGVFFQFMGIWIALVEMSNECEETGWFECLHLSVDFDFDFGDNFDFDGFWDNGP